MERQDGLEVGASPWEIFALGALAPLAPYAQVHLAPKIPPGLLNTALMSYLSLQSDEQLLAVIDGSGGDSPAVVRSRHAVFIGPRSTTATKASQRPEVAFGIESTGGCCAATCSSTTRYRRR